MPTYRHFVYLGINVYIGINAHIGINAYIGIYAYMGIYAYIRHLCLSTYVRKYRPEGTNEMFYMRKSRKVSSKMSLLAEISYS